MAVDNIARGLAAGSSGGANIGAIVPEYDEATTYSKDALISHEGKIYFALEDGITGEWDETKWQETNLAEAIEFLAQRISEVGNIGKYLAIWNCTTGLPTTNPTTIPYAYTTGDYFIIGNVSPNDKITYDGISEGKEVCGGYAVKVSDRTFENPEDLYGTVITMNDGTTITVDSTNCTKDTEGITIMSGSFPQVLIVTDSGENTPGTYFLDMRITIIHTQMWTVSWALADGTNYMPDGTTYDGTASTTVDTGSPQILDMYRFDGTSWSWLDFGQQFRQILNGYYTKTESDNRYALITALNNYYNKAQADAKFAAKEDVIEPQNVVCYDQNGVAHTYEVNMQEVNI